MDVLLIYFLFSMGLNMAMFVIAYLFQTDKITDISYSLTFIAIAGYSYFTSDQSFIDLLLLILVVLWGMRLGGYLLYRIHKIGRDKRFDEIRIKFSSFFLFWIMQGITCFIVMIPIILCNQSTNDTIPNIFLIGISLAIIGWIIEAIADQQKFVFKRKNPDAFMKTGLWSYLQHPNYTGELLFWWGTFIACIPFLTWYIGIIGPLWISFIIIGFSGIPILQKQWKEKYGQDETFKKYHKKTYKLIPFIY